MYDNFCWFVYIYGLHLVYILFSKNITFYKFYIGYKNNLSFKIFKKYIKKLFFVYKIVLYGILFLRVFIMQLYLILIIKNISWFIFTSAKISILYSIGNYGLHYGMNPKEKNFMFYIFVSKKNIVCMINHIFCLLYWVPNFKYKLLFNFFMNSLGWFLNWSLELGLLKNKIIISFYRIHDDSDTNKYNSSNLLLYCYNITSHSWL